MPYPTISARIGALRFCACSSDSRITIPAPSPTTNPSRPASQGRLARAGSSLRVERAFIEANPPTPIGVMVASVPPQIIISAAPRSIILKESPMACAEAEHAVAVAEFGPRAPYRIEICPEAKLTIADGIKNGEIRPGPPFSSFPCSRSMMSNPPIPDETYTPTSSRSECSGLQPDMRTAKSAPASATWMNRPIFFSSFFSIHWKGSKPLISPPMRQSKPVVSKLVIVDTPLTPARRFFQLSSVPMPSAQTSPTPVTTTRRVNCSYSRMRWYCPAALLPFGVLVDILDRILDGRHLLGVLVRHFNPERLLERHHQFHLVQRVRPQVIHERCRGRNFRFIHAQLLDDNLLYALFHAGHSFPPRSAIARAVFAK